MNKHEHNECEHQNLRFCKVCRHPYCPDCGKEWFETYYYYHSPLWSNGTAVDMTPKVSYINCSGHATPSATMV